MPLYVEIFVGLALWTIYLLPAIYAYGQKTPHRAAILALTVLVGWTIIGWFVALFLAHIDAAESDPTSG